MLIKNGIVTDPVTSGQHRLDVRILGDKIVQTQPHLLPESGEPLIDASGCIVSPGLMDAHVHFRDPGFTEKEDILTGAAAAARGGFTTVVCMANTSPAVDTPETLAYIRNKAASAGIRVLQVSSITKGLKGTQLVDMEKMAGSGAAGFSDDGIPLMDERLLKEAMQRAAGLKLPISLHEEDPLFIDGAGVNRGRVSRQIGYGGADAAAEEIMAARDCILALHTGARVCIQHVSSAVTVQIIRCAKSLGADVHGEATPHHFSLTEEAVLRYGTNARMNPPLRTEADRRAIVEGLQDETLDMIVTDHAPHCAGEKERPMALAPSGIIGLETSLGLGIRFLVKPGHLSLPGLLKRMSTNPAGVYSLAPWTVAPGNPADLVIFREDAYWKADHFLSKASNSPFRDWVLPGKVCFTICRGQVVYRG